MIISDVICKDNIFVLNNNNILLLCIEILESHPYHHILKGEHWWKKEM